jgi:hypothetical protein
VAVDYRGLRTIALDLGSRSQLLPKRITVRSDTSRAMSQENLEAIQRGFDAFNRRDTEALLVELHTGP